MLDEQDENQHSSNAGGEDGLGNDTSNAGDEDNAGGQNGGDDTDDGEVTPEKYAALKAEKDKLVGRTKFLEQQIVKHKKDVPSKIKVEETSKEISSVVQRMEAMEQRQLLRDEGYSGDEIALIVKMGGKDSLDKNPVVKKAIEVMRQEKKSKDASPASSPKSPVYQKYTQEDLGKMTSAELSKILPHAEV